MTLFNSGTISGAGSIGDDALTLVNRKSGVIDAQGGAGLDLVIDDSSVGSNSGLIEATGAGVLTINSSAPGTEAGFDNGGTIDDVAATVLTLQDLSITSGGGTIETGVSGATISLDFTTIASGLVSLVAGSTLQTANSDVDWLQTAVDNAGTIDVGGDGTLDVEGNWVNSGAINVDGQLDIAGGSRLALRGGGTVNLSFNGFIQSDDGIGGSGTASLLNLSDTIVGSGEINDSEPDAGQQQVRHDRRHRNGPDDHRHRFERCGQSGNDRSEQFGAGGDFSDAPHRKRTREFGPGDRRSQRLD